MLFALVVDYDCCLLSVDFASKAQRRVTNCRARCGRVTGSVWSSNSGNLRLKAMAALASASTLFRGAALSVSAPAGSSRRARAGVRAEAEASTTSAVPINPSIRKDTDKVVDTVQVAELSKPLVAYCRCWRSETFPLCNGAHAKHNKETGDNVGPLLLKK